MINVRSTVAAFVTGAVALSVPALAQMEEKKPAPAAREAVRQEIDENARAVITRSIDAIKNLKDFSASAHRYVTGPMVGGFVDISGDFRLIKGPNPFASQGYYNGRAKNKSNPNDDTFHCSVQDNVVTWVDNVAKTVFVRPVAPRTEAMNQLTLGHQLLLEELFKNEPYNRVLGAQRITLEGTEEFGGEMCNVIRATFRDGDSWHLWHISVNDHIPRRMEEAVKLPDQAEPIRMILEYSNGKANQNLVRKDLEIVAPEGYQRNEQVAAASPGGDPSAIANVPPPPTLGPGAGKPAPAFELRSGSGDMVSLASLRGNVVVLAFGGTWNGPFTRATPVLQTLHTAFKDKPVRVYAATCREKTDDAPAEFMKERGYGFGVLLHADEVAKEYSVRGFPGFAVIDRDGNVVEFVQGFRGEEILRETLTNAVRKALGEGQ